MIGCAAKRGLRGPRFPIELRSGTVDLSRRDIDIPASNEANVKKLNQRVLLTDAGSAVKGFIRGLYGGFGLPNATQDSDYMPLSWAIEQQDVLSLNWWKTYGRAVPEFVFREPIMPNALFTYRRFNVESDHRQIGDEALTRFGF